MKYRCSHFPGKGGKDRIQSNLTVKHLLITIYHVQIESNTFDEHGKLLQQIPNGMKPSKQQEHYS